MSPKLLQVEGLSLVSDAGYIIENFSFSLTRGEIVALTGKSGSGKSSIGLAILGLLPKGIRMQQGIIQWYNLQDKILSYPQDAGVWSSLRGSQIGYIPQDVFGLFDPVLRMGKQMMLITNEAGKKEHAHAESELRAKMKEVGISDIERVWNSYPHQLSGGQLQRCQVCLSIVLKPALLIADEPTSAIDKINQVEILDILAYVRDEYQMAVLCITHEESVVTYLADRCISIDNNIEQSQAVLTPHSFHDEDNARTILNADNLGYTHRFGGLFDKEGSKIKGMNLSLKAGKCLGIIGESGSGKSTLAQLLVGLLIPSEGILTLYGKEIDFRQQKDISLLRSKIQLVMQDGRGSLHPHKTISWLLREVIDHQKKIDRHYQEDVVRVMDQVGLDAGVLSRKERNLSGGECLRISIARALLMRPDILICDESMTSLDGPTRDGILSLLDSIRQERHLGLIIIAHDDQIIRRIADDILVLSDGEIVEKGKAVDVLNDPQHTSTKKILNAQATLSQKRSL